jgi:hypothetical protein
MVMFLFLKIIFSLEIVNVLKVIKRNEKKGRTL